MIAYGIPSIRYNFKDLKSVIKVPTNNYILFAKYIINLLESGDLEKLYRIAKEEAKLFNWKDVFRSEEKLIKKVIKII
ncbi:hypothetical protein MJ1_0265 [Nanobdella aerobiophila]|uniref:Glycosyltransferase n=1 Tax=Nanobdella aerobiophila TaxID=2586965 RepID=A0A915SF28_9ARCH|nr:hypothetical protein [Nanobdella aerobiophila]BBL45435.1 hypothetical protein MJ1_0265 [Nanobdella aerobiophila]